MDRSQFLNTLKLFHRINLPAAVSDGGDRVWMHVSIAFYCFCLELYDEGFSALTRATSSDLTPSQLAKAKSNTPEHMLKMILTAGSMEAELGNLKLLGRFYLKMGLNFPSLKNNLKQRIKRILNERQPNFMEMSQH